MKVRKIGEEKLDSLPASHPHALANRKDLHLINRLMGTRRWFGRTLPDLVGTSGRILELGAGHGLLSDFLRRRHDQASLWQWHALDIKPVPSRVTKGLQWHQADLMQFGDYNTFEVVFGNFILHQFDETKLQSLGDRFQQGPRALVFQELWRTSAFYWGSLLLTLFMHPVTKHDARVSVRAGFRGQELADQLGLDSATWTVKVEYSPMGAYRMVALRL
ncbi:MAG: class I SAM-dependent methyltransferase [Verrucomicrobia bacterium]|nr:class I SAM-dependent methyltransferase [Verrucomicrobiota bacterium]